MLLISLEFAHIQERQPSYEKYRCECPCHARIPVRDSHKIYGIPRFINGHNLWHHNGGQSPALGKRWTLSEEVKAGIDMSYNRFGNTNGFKKGQKAWNRGKHLSRLHRKRVSEGLKRYFRRNKL